uniref:GNAT family N-acetyltransferase n=1 Tax=Alistipes sp. TaxID=1872444 RepID=UPI004056C413
MDEIREINFHPVTVADKPLFEYYILSSEEQNCDLNFANIFCWSDTYHTEIAEVDGSLVIRFDNGGAKCYMQPFCTGDKSLIIEKLRQDAFSQRAPFRLYGLSREWREFLEKTYPEEFAFDTPRALCDYIYKTEDLAQLQGRKYQPKRNHINHFISRNDWSVVPLSLDNVKDCLALNDKWLQGREIGDMERAEQQALRRAFDNLEVLGLRGLVLYANGAPVAFSYGTAINKDTFCIHIEKYDAEVQGAATMINRLMARSLEEKFEYINREDDLGLEGLRFAKMSYHPTALLEKTSALHLTAEQREMRKMWHEIFGDEIHEIDAFLINHSEAIPLIHKENGEVVSMLYIVPLNMVCKNIAYIYAVATKPEYRGRGIASKLLTKALRMIKASGKFDIAALIPSSTDSKRLYERLGFDDTQMPMNFPPSDYLGTGSIPHDLAMTLTLRE